MMNCQILPIPQLQDAVAADGSSYSSVIQVAYAYGKINNINFTYYITYLQLNFIY